MLFRSGQIALSSSYSQCQPATGPTQYAGSTYYVQVSCANLNIEPVGEADFTNADFQAAQQIGGAIGFGKTGVAAGQRDPGHVAGDIQDTGSAEGRQLSRDLGPEPAVGQPQIEDNKVRLGMACLRNRVGDGTGDAAYFVTVLDKDLFQS